MVHLPYYQVYLNIYVKGAMHSSDCPPATAETTPEREWTATEGEVRSQPEPAAESVFEARRLAFFAGQGFECRGVRLASPQGDTYVLTGGDGVPLRLLIHGGRSEGSEWGLLAPRLGGRIAIADRPGCGLSYRIDYSRIDDYRAAAAAWVGQVVDGLGGAPVDLIANSMGGYFAIAFAVQRPDCVRRLALLGAPAGLLPSMPLALRLASNPIAGQVIRRLAPKDPERSRDRAMRAIVAHPERLPADYLDVASLGGRLPGADLAASTMLRSVASLRGWRPHLLVGEAMTTLDVPTLFAWGEHDAYLPPSAGRPIAERMPNARLEVVTDAGHVPQLDEPEQVARLVNDFLG